MTTADAFCLQDFFVSAVALEFPIGSTAAMALIFDMGKFDSDQTAVALACRKFRCRGTFGHRIGSTIRGSSDGVGAGNRRLRRAS